MRIVIFLLQKEISHNWKWWLSLSAYDWWDACIFAHTNWTQWVATRVCVVAAKATPYARKQSHVAQACLPLEIPWRPISLEHPTHRLASAWSVFDRSCGQGDWGRNPSCFSALLQRHNDAEGREQTWERGAAPPHQHSVTDIDAAHSLLCQVVFVDGTRIATPRDMFIHKIRILVCFHESTYIIVSSIALWIYMSFDLKMASEFSQLVTTHNTNSTSLKWCLWTIRGGRPLMQSPLIGSLRSKASWYLILDAWKPLTGACRD